jgi:hypothetical protein
MNASPHAPRSPRENRLYGLYYHSHRLDEILAEVPSVTAGLSRLGRDQSTRLTQSLRSICAQWTIYARYSPKTAQMDEASDFLDQIEELKPWLT